MFAKETWFAVICKDSSFTNFTCKMVLLQRYLECTTELQELYEDKDG